MKKLILLLLLVCCSANFTACGSKTYTIGDIFFFNIYKATEKAVNYDARPLTVVSLGTERKKVESVMGKGQEYPLEGISQAVYYSGGLTVLYESDVTVLLDYALDETSLPDTRTKAFSLYKDVNLSSSLEDIKSKLGEDFFTLSYASEDVPAQVVYVYEMINGEYGHQILPSYSMSNAEQLRALSGSANVYGIMLYVDANARYQQLYRIKVGKLEDILNFRND